VKSRSYRRSGQTDSIQRRFYDCGECYSDRAVALQLFDFNVEVKPVLEVLVGKTIEQALMEVMEEEELFNLREQQRQFQELRNAELVEQQRLEEQDRRRRVEKVDAGGIFMGGRQ